MYRHLDADNHRMGNFGVPADLSDNEVVEGLHYWRNRLHHFASEGDPEGEKDTEEARTFLEEFTGEAQRRGLL